MVNTIRPRQLHVNAASRYSPETGKRARRSETFSTKRAAQQALAEWTVALDHGTLADTSKQTVGEYLQHWLGGLGDSVRPVTARRYRDLVHQHVIPYIGRAHLAKLTPPIIREWQAERLKAGLSPTTVGILHAILHRALKDAETDNLVNRNVARLVRPPRRARPETTTWTLEQTQRFLAASDRDDYAALWCLAIATGMRRGELLGLRWADVDLDRATIRIQRTVSRGANGGFEVGTPKTASGRRAIALPPSAVNALHRHRAAARALALALGVPWDADGYAFAAVGTDAPGSRPLHPNSLASRFARLIARADVPRIRFHDLRHTNATLSLADGTHPKVVQERLGHANIAMTLDRYSHVTMDLQRDAANRFDALLGRAVGSDG